MISNLYHYTDGTSAGRFYDPLLARFIQPDSFTPDKGSRALNSCAHVKSFPVCYNKLYRNVYSWNSEWGLLKNVPL